MKRDRDECIEEKGKPGVPRHELHMQPGPLDEIETADAYATRTGQHDITSERPRRVAEGEELGGGVRAHPADGLRGADGRIHRGEDIGHGIPARPADGYEREDGVVTPGDDIGHGIRARRADQPDPGNPLI